jgi:hypothetical protein
LKPANKKIVPARLFSSGTSRSARGTDRIPGHEGFDPAVASHWRKAFPPAAITLYCDGKNKKWLIMGKMSVVGASGCWHFDHGQIMCALKRQPTEPASSKREDLLTPVLNLRIQFKFNHLP